MKYWLIKWRSLRPRIKFVLVAALALYGSFAWYIPVHVRATGPNMMLFWDGGSTLPAGWSFVTSINGGATITNRFVRGDATTKVGFVCDGGASATSSCFTGDTNDTTVATRPFTPTVASGGVTMTTNNNNGNATGTTNGTAIAANIAHPVPTMDAGPDNNGSLPAYRSLRLIQYTGIPTTIPAGSIGMFDNTPGLPSTGWTRYSAQDAQMLEVESTAGNTGGNDTVTNQVPSTTVTLATVDTAANPSLNVVNIGTTIASARPTHQHTISSAGVNTSVLPPYVQVLMAKADTDTVSITSGLIAMFDADPGAGWVVESNSGGTYFQKFLRPNTTFSAAGGGSNTHTIGPVIRETSSASGTNAGNTLVSGVNNASGLAHTHTVTTTFNPEGNIPPYFNVIIAEKLTYIQDSYRWYIENNSENVTNPWSSLALPPNTQIAPLPVANDAPTVGRVLRLRVRMLVTTGNTTIGVNTIGFKLQYNATTLSTCKDSGWTDVAAQGATTDPWRYGANTVADFTQLSNSKLTASVLQIFEKSAPGAPNNPKTVTDAQTMEYDWLIEDYSAPDATQYAFRIAQYDGTLLGDYTQCPALVTLPGVDQEMRNGNFFQDGSEKGFEWAN